MIKQTKATESAWVSQCGCTKAVPNSPTVGFHVKFGSSTSNRLRVYAIRNTLHLTEKRVVRSADDNLRLATGFARFSLKKSATLRTQSSTGLETREMTHCSLTLDTPAICSLLFTHQQQARSLMLSGQCHPSHHQWMPCPLPSSKPAPRPLPHWSPASPRCRLTRASFQTGLNSRSSLHCLKRQDQIATVSAIIDRFLTCILSQKSLNVCSWRD